jgi:hypothetical protein
LLKKYYKYFYLEYESGGPEIIFDPAAFSESLQTSSIWTELTSGRSRKLPGALHPPVRRSRQNATFYGIDGSKLRRKP